MYKQQVDLFMADIEAANEAMRALRHRWIDDQRRSSRDRGWGGAVNNDNGINSNIMSTKNGWDLPSPSATIAASSTPMVLAEEGERSMSADGSKVEGDRPESTTATGAAADVAGDRPQSAAVTDVAVVAGA